MKPLILLSLLALAGCKDEVVPCYYNGFKYQNPLGFSDLTNCIPCSQAVSPEARFVCSGVTYTAKP